VTKIRESWRLTQRLKQGRFWNLNEGGKVIKTRVLFVLLLILPGASKFWTLNLG